MLEIVKSECDTKTWQAFWLTTVKHDSAADVAERLEMPVASVYQAKSRILARLRKRMEELP
jgi:RNA polymerase sigma-70 factor (ECF subfamily)